MNKFTSCVHQLNQLMNEISFRLFIDKVVEMMIETNNLEQSKLDLIADITRRVEDKIIEQSNADLLIKLINQADTLTEAIAIAELGTTYKRTGLHFDKRLEKFGNTIKYLSKNDELSFKTSKDAITHKLIIGDNYDALLNLLVSYRGMIDVIYIDPPYGKDSMGEFAQTNYDNALTRDNLLSMMYPRLVLAKQLLSEKGVIFCSIDDKNHSYMKCLFDEIFTEKNFITSCFILDNLKGKTNDNFISSVGSKLLVYAKDKEISNELGFNEIENIFGERIEDKYSQEDEFGFYNTITFKKTGQSKLREDRPYMFYPILQKDGLLYAIKEDEFAKLYNRDKKIFNDSFLQELKQKYSDYEFILPKDSNGAYLRWTSGHNTFLSKMNNDVFYDNGVKQKTRPAPTEMLQYYASGTPKTFMYKTAYSMGTDDLKNVLGDNNFDFPKPVCLIKDLLRLYPSNNCIVLDFFAGSGTTGQAVLDLNKDDNGNRQFILCTNNEITPSTPNGVVKDVTSKRLKRIMTGSCYDGTKDFEWIKKNTPYGDNLDVYEIKSVANFENAEGKTPFDVIDETLYNQTKFNTIKEKIEWVCSNFEGTQKYIENDVEYKKRMEDK